VYPASTGILGLIWFLNLICSIEVHLSFWFRFLWSRVELVIIVRGLCSNLGLLFQYKNFHYLLHVKNIKQIFIIKNVIKPNLFLIFLLPYTHLMGQPTFACWYLARATAKITEPKIWLNYTTIHKVHFIYNKPEYNNTLAFSLNLTFVNKSILFFSELQNLSSPASKATGIDKLDWMKLLNTTPRNSLSATACSSELFRPDYFSQDCQHLHLFYSIIWYQDTAEQCDDCQRWLDSLNCCWTIYHFSKVYCFLTIYYLSFPCYLFSYLIYLHLCPFLSTHSTFIVPNSSSLKSSCSYFSLIAFQQ